MKRSLSNIDHDDEKQVQEEHSLKRLRFSLHGNNNDYSSLSTNLVLHIFNFLSFREDDMLLGVDADDMDDDDDEMEDENHGATATTTNINYWKSLYPPYHFASIDASTKHFIDPLVDHMWIAHRSNINDNNNNNNQPLLFTRHVSFSDECLSHLIVNRARDMWQFVFALRNATSISFRIPTMTQNTTASHHHHHHHNHNQTNNKNSKSSSYIVNNVSIDSRIIQVITDALCDNPHLRFVELRGESGSDVLINSWVNKLKRKRRKQMELTNQTTQLKKLVCCGTDSSKSLTQIIQTFPMLQTLIYHCMSFSVLDQNAFLPQVTCPTLKKLDISSVHHICDSTILQILNIKSLLWFTVNCTGLKRETVHAICSQPSSIEFLEFSLHGLDDHSYELLRDNSTLKALRFPSIYEAKHLQTVLCNNNGSLRTILANSYVDFTAETLDPLRTNTTIQYLDISGSIVVNFEALTVNKSLKFICIGDEEDIAVNEMVRNLDQQWFESLSVQCFSLRSKHPHYFDRLLRQKLPRRIRLEVDDFCSDEMGEEL